VPPSSPLLGHLEQSLGPARTGARYAIGGDAFEIVTFAERPARGCTTYATVGLGDHVLAQASGSPLRQELLFAHRGAPSKDVIALVAAVAEPVLRSRRGLAHGQVLGPSGPILSGSRMEALYCAVPVYFDDALHVFRGVTPPVVLVWLVPLTAREAGLVADHGWTRLEELFQAHDPDLLDLGRAELPG